MKRKLFAGVAAAALALTVTACNNGTTGDSPDAPGGGAGSPSP